MPKQRPHVTTLSDVRITRQAEYAFIDYVDPDISTVHLDIGPQVHDMTDEEILHLHNQVLRKQSEMAATKKWRPIEIPVGKSQLENRPDGSGSLKPRGAVLRCMINDGGDDGETTICIDEHEFSMEEFGGILSHYNGWGMRVIIVERDETDEEPEIVVRDPDDP